MRKRSAHSQNPAKQPSTGPRTREGKAQSSQNARTHGATARRLVNEHEQAAYEAWVDQLSKTYPGDHPLVRIQIERIAQLKVQLDRIQSAISAAHEIERLKKTKWDRAADALEFRAEEIAHLVWTSGDPQLIKKAHIDEHYADLVKPAIELAGLPNLELLTTHQEFLIQAPLFCQYLIDCAERNKLDIDEYASVKQIPPDKPVGKNGMPIPRIIIKRTIEGQPEPPRKNQITDIPIEDLIKTAKWHLLQLSKLVQRSDKARGLVKVTDFVEQSVLPDLDRLDKLMRYQTTVNRQLSTAIGELLAMTKTL